MLTLPAPWWTEKLNKASVGSVSEAHVTSHEALTFGHTQDTFVSLCELKSVQKRDFEITAMTKQESREIRDTFTPRVSRDWTDYEFIDDDIFPVAMVRVWEDGTVYDETVENWTLKNIARVDSAGNHVTVSRDGVSITVESSPLILLQRTTKQTFLHDSDTFYWVDWHRERILKLFKVGNVSEVGHVSIVSGHVLFTYSDSLIVVQSQYEEGASGTIMEPISSAAYRVGLPANLIDKQTQGQVTTQGQHALFLFSTPQVRGFVIDLNKKTIYKADIGDLGCQTPIYSLTEDMGLSVGVLSVQ